MGNQVVGDFEFLTTLLDSLDNSGDMSVLGIKRHRSLTGIDSGFRRIYLNTQVDDMFLITDLYQVRNMIQVLCVANFYSLKDQLSDFVLLTCNITLTG
jgi:hypothetical protein